MRKNEHYRPQIRNFTVNTWLKGAPKKKLENLLARRFGIHVGKDTLERSRSLSW